MVDEAVIRAAVAEVLEVEPNSLSADTKLEEFGTFDSLAHLSLMVCLSDLTGHPIELASLQRLRTFGDVLSLVNDKEAAR